MSFRKSIVKQTNDVPRMTVGILLAVLLFGMFMVGYDQGHIFSIVQGEEAFDSLWMHVLP